MTKNEFECFRLYSALRAYFLGSFDFFKYDGKIKVSPSTYDKRKDKYFFQKLSKKYSTDELKDYFVSNLVNNNTKWTGDLVSIEAEDTYLNFKKLIENFGYIFEVDCIKLQRYQEDYRIKFIEFFKTKSSFGPYLQFVGIRRESMILLNEIVRFQINSTLYKPFELLSQVTNGTPMWDSEERPLLEKYTHFLRFDRPKIKKIIDKYLQEK
jgi:hypothetical protein